MEDNTVRRHSLFGILSLVFGLLSIIVTIIIILVLNQVTGGTFNRNIVFLVNALNIFSVIEIIVKATGVLLGLVGLFHKNRKKVMSVLGLIVNTSTIIWTLIIIYV